MYRYVSHHDFLEHGIHISSLWDQCVLTFLAESGELQIFKLPWSAVNWKILSLEIWGNIAEIFQQLLSELPTLIIVLRWSPVKFVIQIFHKMLTARTGARSWSVPHSCQHLNCTFAHSLSGSWKGTIHLLHVSGHMGVKANFYYCYFLSLICVLTEGRWFCLWKAKEPYLLSLSYHHWWGQLIKVRSHTMYLNYLFKFSLSFLNSGSCFQAGKLMNVTLKSYPNECYVQN